MRIGIRIFLGYFLVLGLTVWLVLNTAMDEIKPIVRQATETSLMNSAAMLALLAEPALQYSQTTQTPFAQSSFAAQLKQYQIRRAHAKIWGILKNKNEYRVYISNQQGIVVFDSDHGAAVGQDYSKWNDVYLTLRGQYGARSTANDYRDKNSTVMYVAAPIYQGQQIIGVLTLAAPNASLQPIIDRTSQKILRWSSSIVAISFFIGLFLSVRLVRALKQISRYALAVSRSERRPPPLHLLKQGEIGVLLQAIEVMREHLEGKKYVETYIHSLTHELKSPLAAIRAASELLTDQQMPITQQQRFLNNIALESERLQRIIEQMLLLAMVEQRQSLKNISPINLNELICSSLESKQAQLIQKEIILDNQLCAAEQATIQAERFLLQQAISNLLDNAIDFCPKQGKIMLSLTQLNPQQWQISLHNSGAGIPDYALGHIFERFYSLPRPDTQRKSTGLGLSFVREVATLHRGSIVLENTSTGVNAHLTLQGE